MLRFGVIAVIATLVCAPACADEAIVLYDRAAAAANKSVGLLTPGWPAGPGVVAAGKVQPRQEESLKAVLTSDKIDAEADFLETLRYQLRQEGYAVSDIPADAKRTGRLNVLPDKYKQDSFLNVTVLNYGYIQGGIAKDALYRPWVVVQAQLINSLDGSVLMQAMVTYNAQADAKNVIAITPDPMYSFKNWDAVHADKDLAAEGLSHALRQTAQTIAGLMR